jgi:hypothetical protein
VGTGNSLTAFTMVLASLAFAPAAKAGNGLPKWTHVALSHTDRGALTVNYRTQTVSTATSVAAIFIGPHDGPAPYQSFVSLTATGAASAVARTGIGFSGNATGFSYPLTLELNGAGGVIGIVDVDARVRAKGAASDDDEDVDPAGAASAEIIALDDQDGDGDPDAYRVVVVAGAEFGRVVSKVTIKFRPFQGPAPHALSLTVPFKVFNRVFASDRLDFDGDPVGFSYEVGLTPYGSDGKPLAAEVSQTVKVKRDRAVPTIGAVAIRTAPTDEACAGGPEEEGTGYVTCTTEELQSLSGRLAQLSEVAALYTLDADAAEAAMAYTDGTQPWEWAGSGEIFRAYVATAALASAKALMVQDAIGDALLGLSATEAVELALLTDSEHPFDVEESAFEIGQGMGGGFFLSLESGVPIAPGQEVYPYQVVAGGFAFDPSEIKERLASSGVAERPRHPIGLRIGISKGWESARADWDGLNDTPWEVLTSHVLVDGANVAIVMPLPEQDAEAARSELIAAYEQREAEARAERDARDGGRLWTSDPVYLKHRQQAVSGQVLALPGIFDVLEGGQGALLVSLETGKTSFVPGSEPAEDPNTSMMALRRGDNPGAAGFWTVYDVDKADAAVTWLLGSPAASPEAARAAATTAAKAAVTAVAEFQSITREIDGSHAAAARLNPDLTKRKLRPTGFYIIVE